MHPYTGEVEVKLTAETTVVAHVISSEQDVNSAWRYTLTFQQTDGNSIDTAELNNIHEIYVTGKE